MTAQQRVESFFQGLYVGDVWVYSYRTRKWRCTSGHDEATKFIAETPGMHRRFEGDFNSKWLDMV